MESIKPNHDITIDVHPDESLDAHIIRNSRWNHVYLMTKLNYTIKGYSRAAFRTGFYIPELGIMLDAGPQCFNRPSHIFITHSHADHVAELPFTLIEDDGGESSSETRIYGPVGTKDLICNYIQSMYAMNSMGHDPRGYKREPQEQKTGREEDFESDEPLVQWKKGYIYEELKEMDEFELKLKKKDIRVKIIDCDHTVKTISYIFTQVKEKLKPELVGLPGNFIAALRTEGAPIYYLQEVPLFSYVCDCSIKTIEKHELSLIQCPYVIVECTFLLEDEIENSIKTKHIHWNQLEPFVATNPNTEWILIHFSLRYRDKEIIEFFKEKTIKYPNLKIWA